MISSLEMLALAALLLGAVDGRSTRSYDSAGNLLTTVDAGGHATSFGVNASGQVTAKTGPQPGEAWSFEYDVFGQLKTKALVRGATARAGWKGAVWSYQYGLTDGATVKETGPGGYTTLRWYNARHQLLKELRSDVGAARSSSNEWTMAQVWDGERWQRPAVCSNPEEPGGGRAAGQASRAGAVSVARTPSGGRSVTAVDWTRDGGMLPTRPQAPDREQEATRVKPRTGRWNSSALQATTRPVRPPRGSMTPR